jgi:uncharacterized membrane protein
MAGPALQWFTLLAHWFHVIIGVMWIGASFYLISWENKFNRKVGLREGVEGNFWTIQGGDFYYVEKLEYAPAQLPDELHWFKYEAYLTWISGFLLLSIVFYVDARAMMLNARHADWSPLAAVALSTGSLLFCWLTYYAFARTPLARNFPLSAVLGLIALAALSYFFSQMFNQRAAFIHVGAVMGTIMSGNVFFVIIPWHKKLIGAISNKQPLEELYALRPGYLSRHNHYMTLPVFLIMLGGHFPFVFDRPHSWAIVTAIALSAGLFKHFHNLIQKQQSGVIYLLASLVVFGGAVFAAVQPATEEAACQKAVSVTEAYQIVATHCLACHSTAPTHPDWKKPPNGVVFDTMDQVLTRKDRVLDRVFVARTMPLGNQTQMQSVERDALRCWIERAAEKAG